MILKKEKLNGLLDMLAGEATVFVPTVLESDEPEGAAALTTHTGFVPYVPGVAVDFGSAKTTRSPKMNLFPQTETLYTYSQLGEDITLEETVNNTNQILFGVRSCDSYSIERTDEVFLTRSFVDTLYYERRAGTLIVALGCTKPERTCFCSSFGIDPSQAPGADIQLTQLADADSGYFVEALTEKGTEMLAQWKPFLTDGAKPAVEGLVFSYTFDTSGLKETFKGKFDDPYWQDLSMKCLGCGTCAYACPSCYCFDMSQNNKGNTGYRFRTWDSCTFIDYSMMAGFHNPRPTKMNRLRNRFMHKLCFYEDRYGSSLCCGCGRCIELCPVGIDISRVIEDVGKVEARASVVSVPGGGTAVAAAPAAAAPVAVAEVAPAAAPVAAPATVSVESRDERPRSSASNSDDNTDQTDDRGRSSLQEAVATPVATAPAAPAAAPAAAAPVAAPATASVESRDERPRSSASNSDDNTDQTDDRGRSSLQEAATPPAAPLVSSAPAVPEPGIPDPMSAERISAEPVNAEPISGWPVTPAPAPAPRTAQQGGDWPSSTKAASSAPLTAQPAGDWPGSAAASSTESASPEPASPEPASPEPASPEPDKPKPQSRFSSLNPQASEGGDS